MKKVVSVLLAVFLATPAVAQSDLGTFFAWGAFRDEGGERCYAIAEPEEVAGKPSRRSFASFGFWPKRGVRAQFHARLSRDRSTNAGVTLSIGTRRFRLTADRQNGWAQDARMDRAIVRALRGASSLSIESVGRDGRPIVDAYILRGASSAIDAASLACTS